MISECAKSVCMCVYVCVKEKESEVGYEGGTGCLHARMQVYVCLVSWTCDRELALILLVVIGVSVRPHTLGCGCNCPWQAGL